MKRRIDALTARGIDTEFHVYPDLGHGFGLGVGTSAQGWLDDAVTFWEGTCSEENPARPEPRP